MTSPAPAGSAAQQLAHVGVTRYALVDGDRASTHSLNRLRPSNIFGHRSGIGDCLDDEVALEITDYVLSGTGA